MEEPPRPDVTGDLRRTPVAQLLWDLAARRFTGTLVLRAGADGGPLEGESRFTFIAGAVSQARLAQPLDTLGFVLHEQGSITSAQLDASLMRLAKREGLQGEILVSLGACSRPTVEGALREQLRRKVLRLFNLVYGQYDLYADRDLLADFGRERYPVDVLPLLWPGVRSHPRHPAIDAVIERLGAQPMRVRPTSPARSLFGEGAPERSLLDRLAESARVDDLLALSIPPLLTRSVVFFLAMTRQIERAPSASQPDVPAAPAPRTSQVSLPAAAPRISQTAIPALRQSPSQTDLVAAPGEARKAPSEGPTPRISATNLPSVKGPSLGEVRRASQNPPPYGNLRARIAEAEQQLARMQDQTVFQMLGVAPDAGEHTVGVAFRSLAVRWHPDAAPANSPALREAHERIFALLAEAEATLCDERLREAYLRDMAQGNGTPRARGTRTRRQQELARAEVALRQKLYPEAERASRAVLEDDATDAAALTILAAALIELNPSGPYDEVRRCIVAACQKDPNNDRAHVVAATMYKRLGDERRTLAHFIKAYKLNPRNTDAMRELRLAAMRRRDAGAIDQESAGFLARLFGIGK